MSDLVLAPVTRRAAYTFIRKHHRHHKPPTGHKFAIAALADGGRLVGVVVVVGRPVARHFDDFTAEVTRLCTDGTPNVCSLLYGAAARAAKAMGYKKIITYILEREHGASLKAAGWQREKRSAGGLWSRPSRARADDHPTESKTRWSRQLGTGMGVFA